jgi:hypothetical protein
MPNHVHAITVLGAYPPPVDRAGRDSVAVWQVVRAFKAATTRLIRVQAVAEFGWQRNYFEQIVRTDGELVRFRKWVEGNPGLWELDREKSRPSPTSANVTGRRLSRAGVPVEVGSR